MLMEREDYNETVSVLKERVGRFNEYLSNPDKFFRGGREIIPVMYAKDFISGGRQLRTVYNFMDMLKTIHGRNMQIVIDNSIVTYCSSGLLVSIRPLETFNVKRSLELFPVNIDTICEETVIAVSEKLELSDETERSIPVHQLRTCDLPMRIIEILTENGILSLYDIKYWLDNEKELLKIKGIGRGSIRKIRKALYLYYGL